MNGKRHGKGIEYYSNEKISFKGEYSHGYKIEGKGYYINGKLSFILKRNGIIKEYDYKGKLSYQGEFLNDKKNGKGKEYYEKGKLHFDGEYKNDILNGKVKEYNEKGKLIFEGEYKDGKKWTGRANAEEFQGEYLNGEKWNGKGKEWEHIKMGFEPRDLVVLVTLEGEYINGKKRNRKRDFSYRKKEIYTFEYDGTNNNIDLHYDMENYNYVVDFNDEDHFDFDKSF